MHKSAWCELLDDCLVAHVPQNIAGESSAQDLHIQAAETFTVPSKTVAQPSHCRPDKASVQAALQFSKSGDPFGHWCFDARMADGEVIGVMNGGGRS